EPSKTRRPKSLLYFSFTTFGLGAGAFFSLWRLDPQHGVYIPSFSQWPCLALSGPAAPKHNWPLGRFADLPHYYSGKREKPQQMLTNTKAADTRLIKTDGGD